MEARWVRGEVEIWSHDLNEDCDVFEEVVCSRVDVDVVKARGCVGRDIDRQECGARCGC